MEKSANLLNKYYSKLETAKTPEEARELMRLASQVYLKIKDRPITDIADVLRISTERLQISEENPTLNPVVIRLSEQIRKRVEQNAGS